MSIFTGKIRKIVLLLCVLYSIFSVVMTGFYVAVLIQYPPYRANWSWIGLTVFSFGNLVFFLFVAMKLSKNRIARDTYYFAIIALSISFLLALLGNIYLNLGFSYDQIVAISIVISTPLSCLIAGYSKRTVIARLKRLGLDQGVTLFAIAILALVPIIRYPVVLWSGTGTITMYLLPDLAFQMTPNTTLVNGEIKESAFISEIPTHQNQIFEAERFIDVNVTNWGNESIMFQFAISGFKGSFESIQQLQLDALSSSDRKTLFFIDDEGMLQCNQTILLLKPYDKLSFSVKCLTTGQIVSNASPSISISISDHNTILKKLAIVFKGN